VKWFKALPVGALVLALASLAGRSTADDKAVPKEATARFLECAKACHDCARICDACSTHCAHLIAAGKKEHLHTLHTCQDCATTCNAAAAITARAGPFSDAICTACAEACKRCGDACEKHADDAMMKACADECRKCERACREMLKHVEKR
jgi:hypothetical protein